MKKVIVICLSFVLIMTSCKNHVATVATTDEELYKQLQVPLIETIIDNGTTLHPDGNKGQVFSYTFNGYMTDQPYRITLSKDVAFEDCAGCIGDWKIGMFSKPEYNNNFISLKEFIIQMVHTNDENANTPTNGKTVTPEMIWRTGGFIWKVTPTNKKDEYLIEVDSPLYDKKWAVRV